MDIWGFISAAFIGYCIILVLKMIFAITLMIPIAIVFVLFLIWKWVFQDKNNSDSDSKEQDGLGVIIRAVVAVTCITLFYNSCGVELKSYDIPNKPAMSSFKENKLVDKELISLLMPARLFDTVDDMQKIYANYGDKVSYKTRSKVEKPLIRYETTMPSSKNDPEIIEGVAIYLQHSKEKIELDVKEAIKIAENYLPWAIVDEYYKLDYTRSALYEGGEELYEIKYCLKDIYSTNYKPQKHTFPETIGIVVDTDSNKRVSKICVRRNMNNPFGESLSTYQKGKSYKYKMVEWHPDYLHKLPAVTDRSEEIWQLLTKEQHPKLLDNYDEMLAYGKKLGEENVYLEVQYDRNFYGLQHRDQLFDVLGHTRKDNSKYIFRVSFNFLYLAKYKHVSIDEAIVIVKSYLPYELMDKYYEFNFARRKVPSGKNLDGSISYQVVYDRVEDDDLRKEMRKKELPENIQISMYEDEDGHVTSLSISGYTYSPKNTTYYEEVKTWDGEVKEIVHPGRVLGPYESDSKWYAYEYWENPF